MINFLSIVESATTWNDIYTKLVLYNTDKDRSAGRLFEEFCKYYYLTEPTVKNEYKNVWLFKEAPIRIKEKLNVNIGSREYGIDLIMEGYDDTLSVVQCKFSNDQNRNISWTKDSIANLFAEGDRADYFIVFTNASSLDTHSLMKKSNQLKLVALNHLLFLSSFTIEAIKNRVAGLTTLVYKPKKPRKHQVKAIQAIVKGFKQYDRGQLVLPCGAGKTLVSLWVRKALNVKHTLVLVPSLALLNQIKTEWAENSSSCFTPYICVCSERDIDNRRDSLIMYSHEISGKVTTNAVEIKNFLNKFPETIIYSTYQSLDSIRSAIKDSDFKFDLAVCDEAHKTAGSKYGKFSLIHSDANIPVKKRLYMTATPRVLSDNIRKKLNEEKVNFLYDMNNSDIFGPEFYKMSFKEAIEKNIILDYKIFAVGINDQEIYEAIKNNKYVSNSEKLDQIANNVALKKFMDIHNLTHAITFHSSIIKAKDFQVRHKKIDSELNVYHVNGEITTNKRNLMMEEFKESFKAVMTNSRCLTEGVDVPAIDAVYFCDPKKSTIDIVQSVGRVLRKSSLKIKKFGYIIVPIFHKKNVCLEKSIDGSQFKNLVNVIRALCSHDERIIDEIKKIKLPSEKRIVIEEESLQNSAFSIITIEGIPGDIKQSIFFQLINKIPIPWRSFLEARDFAHSLSLKSKNDWIKYYTGSQRPIDIPSVPDRVYKYKGWQGWGDWLGTGNKHPGTNNFLSFEDARKYVHVLGLRNGKDWVNYASSSSKPDFIPATPAQVYKNKGWKSWGDWLGTGSKHPGYKKCLPYYKAEKYAHQLHLKNEKQWRQHWREHKPSEIPAKPDVYYKKINQWISWGVFLGTGAVQSQKMSKKSFKEAREYVHALKLSNRKSWELFCQSIGRPLDIPKKPWDTYKKEGWVSLGDWLGTNYIHTINRKYLSYTESKKIIQKFNIKSVSEWRKFSKTTMKPENIPAAPNIHYKSSGWLSWNDWLGNNNMSPKDYDFLSFDAARKLIQRYHFKNIFDWYKFCKDGKRPFNIPSNPASYYENKGWNGWGDWLGTGNIATFNRKYRPFADAKKFVHSLKLKKRIDWRNYCRATEKPDDLPAIPEVVYKNIGWISWQDWLGASNKK